jgi:stage III sporulation protein SpoIIIAA
MPEVLIVDEIGTEAEALACRTIAERGVVLIGTAHGCFLENLIKNPTLSGEGPTCGCLNRRLLPEQTPAA